jgi:hypothetical protein
VAGADRTVNKALKGEMVMSRSYYIQMMKQKDERITELESALDKLIDRAQQVDSWESFPDGWLDEAFEALKDKP